MENDSSFKIEELEELVDLSTWIVDTASKDRQFYISKYEKQLENENAIWLHDYQGAFGNWAEFVKLLDTLILLYDKVFWYRLPSGLVIRDRWNEYLTIEPSLRKAGIDESFPERLVEFIRRGAIVPLGPHHGPPLEDQLELYIRMAPCSCTYWIASACVGNVGIWIPTPPNPNDSIHDAEHSSAK